MIVIAFSTEGSCQEFIASIEARIEHQPGWSYAVPERLKDGRWFVQIVPLAAAVLTPDEAASVVEIAPSDIYQPEEI